MSNNHPDQRDRLGNRLIGGLLVFIAVVAIIVLAIYMKEPSKGPGNVPANGAVTPLQDNGSPPTSK